MISVGNFELFSRQYLKISQDFFIEFTTEPVPVLCIDSLLIYLVNFIVVSALFLLGFLYGFSTRNKTQFLCFFCDMRRRILPRTMYYKHATTRRIITSFSMGFFH